MKIELDLPDWVEERHIRIFAGIEEVAKKLQGQPWQVKRERCDYCGRCCMNLPDNWRHGVKMMDDKQVCKHLGKDGSKYVCTIDRPFFCCSGDDTTLDYCSVEWEKIE